MEKLGKNIFSYCKIIKRRKKRVQTKTLAKSVGVNTRNTRRNIQKLITKGLITINGVHNNRTITLTKNGRKKSIKL